MILKALYLTNAAGARQHQTAQKSDECEYSWNLIKSCQLTFVKNFRESEKYDIFEKKI